MDNLARHFVLTVSCPDKQGIVHALTAVLVEHGCTITEHQQFDDPVHSLLFLRTCFSSPMAGQDELTSAFARVAANFDMDLALDDAQARPRALVMVSRMGHCLNDLLYRWQAGSLGVDIALVVSNHEDLRTIAASAGVPFIHVPVSPSTKEAAEARLLELVDRHEVDLVVLARYMQVLSDELCTQLHGRIINIHHSFLPSFKGAKPYHQAYARGVKQVGATAHYVTPALDEGPIIEQEVIRVDHTYGPEDLVTIGRDAEALALARAVRWHGERRVLLNGDRTVVLR